MLKCGGPTFPTCENSVIQCVVDPQVKKMRRVAQTGTENRQTARTEALRHVQFLNSCNTYTRERLARVQNRARINYNKNCFFFYLPVWCLSDK